MAEHMPPADPGPGESAGAAHLVKDLNELGIATVTSVDMSMRHGDGPEAGPSEGAPREPVSCVYHEEEVVPMEESWTCFGWLFTIAEELAFTTFFRVYVYVLLFGNITLLLAFGYNVLLSLTYRMLVPPNSRKFFTSFGMMCGFWTFLILLTTFISLGVQLLVSWMRLSRSSVNVFFIPNMAADGLDAVQTRNHHLLWFEVVTLFVPMIYAIVKVVAEGQSFTRFLGHFSFCGFCAFECLVLLCWLYFWVRSVRTKSQAWREGSRLKRLRKDNEPEPEDVDDYHHGREYELEDREDDPPRGGSDLSLQGRTPPRSPTSRAPPGRSFRRGRRYDDEASEVSEYRRRRSMHVRRGESGRSMSAGSPPRSTVDDDSAVWHRKVLSNPYVMAEFGTDLFSMQAYFVHVVIGLGWVLLASYPLSVTIDNIAWVAIVVFTLIGGSALLYQHVSRTKARKIAVRQRRVAFALMILFVLLSLVGIASAFATSVWYGLALCVGILMTQVFMVRRHDMHVRDPSEGGAFFFPKTDFQGREVRRRRHQGNPSVWIPLLPCGPCWHACCPGMGCFQPEDRDVETDRKIFKGLQSNASRRGLAALVLGRAGIYDKVIRPVPLPPYSTETLTTPGGKTANVREHHLNRRERVLTADARLQTWYLLFFLVVVGFAYAAGSWTTPDGTSAEPAALAANAAFPGSKSYLTCSMAWEHPRDPGNETEAEACTANCTAPALSLVDFALLSYVADASSEAEREAPSPRKRALDTWFRLPNKRVVENANETDAVSKAFTTQHGAPVGWTTFDGYRRWNMSAVPPALPATPSYRVVVVRHAEFGKEWMRDVDTWGDAFTYQVLAALNPLFALWAPGDQAGFVKFLYFFKRLLHSFDEMDALEEHVEALVSTGVPVYLTGHGVHGGWARLLAHKLKGAVPVVTFGAPGIKWTAAKLGIDTSHAVSEVTVAPQSGLLDMVDRHTGLVQQTACDGGNSMHGCQNLLNTVCDLLRKCGDDAGRHFDGFPAAAGAAAENAVCEYDIP